MQILTKSIKKIGQGNLDAPVPALKNDEFGVFEIGMDRRGEIDYLSKIIKDSAIFQYYIFICKYIYNSVHSNQFLAS